MEGLLILSVEALVDSKQISYTNILGYRLHSLIYNILLHDQILGLEQRWLPVAQTFICLTFQ